MIAAALALVVLLAVAGHFSLDALLTRFLRPKLEQIFVAHFPGASLHLGALHYDVWADRLECDSVAMRRRDGAPVSAGAIAATGLHWGRLLVRPSTPAEIFRSAALDVADVSTVLPDGEYRVQCGHLHLSVPDATGTAQALALQPIVSDETFFSASQFRRVRFRVAVAACSLRGVDFAALLNGEAYRAQSLVVTGAVIESLVNHDKPRRPLPILPMPHEALAAIAKPFRLDRLTLNDGRIEFAARRSIGAEPGVLTFTAVRIRAQEIANAPAGGRAIALTAEGRLMDAGTLAVQARIPVAPATLAFHYTGSLSAMELTRLDAYMEGSGRVRIRSGSVSEARFDIDVEAGHARGVVRGEYRELVVTVVNGETGSEKGVVNRVETVLANALKVRNANLPGKVGKVDYVRRPEDAFLPFAWFALRTGLLDLVSLPARP